MWHILNISTKITTDNKNIDLCPPLDRFKLCLFYCSVVVRGYYHMKKRHQHIPSIGQAIKSETIQTSQNFRVHWRTQHMKLISTQSFYVLTVSTFNSVLKDCVLYIGCFCFEKLHGELISLCMRCCKCSGLGTCEFRLCYLFSFEFLPLADELHQQSGFFKVVPKLLPVPQCFSCCRNLFIHLRLQRTTCF